MVVLVRVKAKPAVAKGFNHAVASRTKNLILCHLTALGGVNLSEVSCLGQWGSCTPNGHSGTQFSRILLLLPRE